MSRSGSPLDGLSINRDGEVLVDDRSAQLLAEYLHGNDDAARRIVDKYTVRLIALAQSYLSPMLQPRVDPEDIVQSAYRSFFRKVRDQEYLLKRSGDLWRLLAAFTRNKARSHVERELADMRDPRQQASLLDVEEGDPTPEEAAVLVEQLTLFFRRLPPRQRRVVELRMRGETVDAIVHELGNPDPQSAMPREVLSAATVRRLLREARQVLEEVLLDS